MIELKRINVYTGFKVTDSRDGTIAEAIPPSR